MKKSTVKSIAFAAAAFFAALPLSATTIKALSFAIRQSSGSSDGDYIKNFMGSNDIDFGVFDYAKAPRYFISADFTSGNRNYKVSNCDYGGGNNHMYKFAVWNSDKYELVSSLGDYKTGENVAAVFRDKFGDEFALLSVCGTYDTDSSLAAVKTYVEKITNDWSGTKVIVTYNARLSGSYNENSYSNVLDKYLTETASGPQLTRLGRTSGGGAYMYQADIPQSYSVSVVDSIGTTYPGTLVSLNYPTKCKVIFNDWDGTGLQTNIVYAG